MLPDLSDLLPRQDGRRSRVLCPGRGGVRGAGSVAWEFAVFERGANGPNRRCGLLECRGSRDVDAAVPLAAEEARRSVRGTPNLVVP